MGKGLDPATAYADQVVRGKVANGQLVRLACERHLRDLKSGRQRGLLWKPEVAERAIRFFGGLRHSKGEWAGQRFELAPWQQFLVGSLFGWKKADGMRRFRTAYNEVGRKNGKSTFAAGVGLYLFVADGEPGAEIYSAATKRDQARIIHSESVRMVKKSPALRKYVGIHKDNLFMEATASFYRPLGADADTMDGLNPAGVIVDELHAHKTRAMWDVLDTAMAARRQPVLFTVTTAGTDRLSVCYEQHVYAEGVLKGTVQDDGYFAFIASIDEGDDWTSEVAWLKANPNYGISVKPEDMRQLCRQALQMPSKQNAFKRLRLNIWCVTGDVLISLADGALRRADQIEEGDIVVAFEQDSGRLVRARVRRALPMGDQPVYKILTARGRIVHTTGDHAFWVRQGQASAPRYSWIRAADLSVGSRVAVALGSPPLPRGSRRISARLARFFGQMIGDGSTRGPGIRFTNRAAEVVASVRSFVESVGDGLKPLPDGVHWDVRHRSRVGTLRQTATKRLLKKYGLYGKDYSTKRVPSPVLKGGARVGAAFLSGYLDTDGWVDDNTVGWTSANASLLADCQHLLARLGAQAALVNGGGGYHLEVRDAESAALLARILTPIHPGKAMKLQTHADRQGEALKDRRAFDRVVAVERCGPMPVFGMEIEGAHTHVTNGFITHNTQQVTRWIDLGLWDRQAGLVKEEDLRGRICYGGFDMGETYDLAAWVLIFPDPNDVETVDVIARFWCPEPRLYADDNRYREVYQAWARQGLLRTTPGKSIEYAFIKKQIMEDAATFQIVDFNFDRWHTHQLMQELENEGLRPVSVGMGYQSMAEPMREFERLLLAEKVRHGGNPILRWMADNVAVRQDPAGNVKPDKHESQGKIDGIVALVMAIDRAMRHRSGSVYDTRGLRVVGGPPESA